jgi:hypothetical protein
MRYFPHRSYFWYFLGPHDSIPQLSYVANRLPAGNFLRCQTRWKAPGNTRLGTPNCGNAIIRKSGLQNGTQWYPFHCISYEAFGWQEICNRCQCEASCPLLSTKHLTLISFTLGYQPWCHGGQMLKYQWLITWRFDMCHVCIQVRINFRASRVLVTLLFETSLYIIINFKLYCLLMFIMEN